LQGKEGKKKEAYLLHEKVTLARSTRAAQQQRSINEGKSRTETCGAMEEDLCVLLQWNSKMCNNLKHTMMTKNLVTKRKKKLRINQKLYNVNLKI